VFLHVLMTLRAKVFRNSSSLDRLQFPAVRKKGAWCVEQLRAKMRCRYCVTVAWNSYWCTHRVSWATLATFFFYAFPHRVASAHFDP
jgi:hypothetical protein